MTSPPELPAAPLAVLRRWHRATWRTHPHGRVALEPGPRFGDPGAGFARLNCATGTDVLAAAIGRTFAPLTDGSSR